MMHSTVTGENRAARLANEAWESLLVAHTSLMRRFIAENTWAELSMREYDVLYTLSKHSNPVHLGDLQRHVLLSQPALSRLVERLVGRELVHRQSDPTDGRRVLLSLTGEGAAAQRRVGRRHARSVAGAMTTALDRQQLDDLRVICEALAAAADTRDDRNAT